jgi:hypothetical protein
MIKPKYKKGIDLSQLARLTVEYATGAPLVPGGYLKPENKSVDHNSNKRNHTKKSQRLKK